MQMKYNEQIERHVSKCVPLTGDRVTMSNSVGSKVGFLDGAYVGGLDA